MLLAPGATPFNPTYTIQYSREKKASSDTPPKITITHHPDQTTISGREAAVLIIPSQRDCEANVNDSASVELRYPWETWNCALLPCNGDPDGSQEWLSDVGTLEGHNMTWQYLGPYPSGGQGYVLRCFDIDEAYRDVVSVVMQGDPSVGVTQGRIEIDVRILKDQNGLDEVIGVAIAAWWQYRVGRNQIGDNFVSRKSSTSSSSSSSDGGKVKKPSKVGKFMKKFT
jgi:hypothetical protein